MNKNPDLFLTWRKAFRLAANWRVLAIWLLALNATTLIGTLPFWRALATRADHAINPGSWANSIDASFIAELVTQLAPSGPALVASILLAMLTTIIISPLTQAATATSLTEASTANFSRYVQGAVAGYRKMLACLSLASLPFVVLAILAVCAMLVISKLDKHSIVADDLVYLKLAVGVALLLLYVLAQASVDAMRAGVMYSFPPRSAFACWRQATRDIIKRPLWIICLYLALLAPGFGLITVINLVQMALPPASSSTLLMHFVLNQCATIILAGMFAMRLQAMQTLQSHLHRQLFPAQYATRTD